MAAEHFNVEPVSNMHRVTGTSTSSEQNGKKKQFAKPENKKKEELDAELEDKINEGDDGIEREFHVIDYKA